MKKLTDDEILALWRAGKLRVIEPTNADRDAFNRALDREAYEPDDPKHPDYHDHMSTIYDDREK